MSKYKAEILRAVDMRGTMSVQELAQLLGVSGQTIRRVTRPMAELGELSKVHGALVSNRTASDPPFLARMNANRRAKVAIAKEVAEIIQDGDSIAIDAGSTSAFIAQALQSRSQLTVVTNSAFVASTLAMVPGNNVSIAGTQLRDHDGAAFDRSVFEVIDRMQVDYVVLSASMVDPTRGFLVYEQCEVDVATAMRNRATCAIMAVDHSKFGPQSRKPSLRQPDLKSGDILVTDRPIAEAYASSFPDLRVRIAR